MSKRVLITAGAVFGFLDDNKLVTNRSRGIWAVKYATHLCNKGHNVTLLVPSTMPDSPVTGAYFTTKEAASRLNRIEHRGYDDYRSICNRLAPEMDAAVMAAAVVNWLPAEPIKGKMPTAGYSPGDRIDVPFYLVPRVIDEMKARNPKLTLIGCKMTSRATPEHLVEEAYKTLLGSHANVIVANDLQNLKTKLLVYPDRTVVTHDDAFEQFFADLDAVIDDVHYRTVHNEGEPARNPDAVRLFNSIVEGNRVRFVKRSVGSDRVFGAVAVCNGGYNWLVSPREKGEMFDASSAVLVQGSLNYPLDPQVIVAGPGKATLNAPLLMRVGAKYDALAVLHLHEFLPDVPTVDYAPPGTVRDNNRDIPGPAFNIRGHGFVAVVK